MVRDALTRSASANVRLDCLRTASNYISARACSAAASNDKLCRCRGDKSVRAVHFSIYSCCTVHAMTCL